MSDETIVRLFDALNRHDAEAAASCYHSDAVFTDPAFGRLEAGHVGHMWRMLLRQSPDLAVELLEHAASGSEGWARWSARYQFSKTGRPVVNNVSSRFVFDDNLIIEQVDEFPLREWGRQALGGPGVALGAVRLLQPVIRRQARSRLTAHMTPTRPHG